MKKYVPFILPQEQMTVSKNWVVLKKIQDRDEQLSCWLCLVFSLGKLSHAR